MLRRIVPTITHKIFETNSSFHVKSFISVFEKFSASISETYILAGSLGTRLSFYQV